MPPGRPRTTDAAQDEIPGGVRASEDSTQHLPGCQIRGRAQSIRCSDSVDSKRAGEAEAVPPAAPGDGRGGGRTEGGPAKVGNEVAEGLRRRSPRHGTAPPRHWGQSPVPSGGIRAGLGRPTGDERRNARLRSDPLESPSLIARRPLPGERITPGAPGAATGCRTPGHDPGPSAVGILAGGQGSGTRRHPVQREYPGGRHERRVPPPMTRNPHCATAISRQSPPGYPERQPVADPDTIPRGGSAVGRLARASPGRKRAVATGRGGGADIHPPPRAGAPTPARRSSPCGFGR